MILAVDVGNTNIVLGCLKGDETLFIERLSTDTGKTAMEYAILIRAAFQVHKISPGKLGGAIIGSVVPWVTTVLSDAIWKLFSIRALIVGPGLKTGLNIRLEDPNAVGADLVAGAVGALYKYSAPLIIIDMGTATTIAVVDAESNYLGGMIMPGVRMSLGSLVSKAAMLKDVSLRPPKGAIGRNTEDAIRSGILYGHAAMLDGLIDRAEEELGQKAVIVATGGLAPTVVKACRHEILEDDDLLLTGLRVIYEKNRH